MSKMVAFGVLDAVKHLFEYNPHGVGELIVVMKFAHVTSFYHPYFLMNIPLKLS